MANTNTMKVLPLSIAPGDIVIQGGTRYAVVTDGKVDAVAQEKKTQSTRLLKAACSSCGYTVRVTKRWADKGLPPCPTCTTYDEGPDGRLTLKHLQTLSL